MKKNQIEASLRASICALVSTRNIASWVEPTLLNMRILRAQLALNGKAVIHCTVPCCYGDIQQRASMEKPHHCRGT